MGPGGCLGVSGGGCCKLQTWGCYGEGVVGLQEWRVSGVEGGCRQDPRPLDIPLVNTTVILKWYNCIVTRTNKILTHGLNETNPTIATVKNLGP